MPPFQGRLLNVTTPQAPATQNYQLVSVGAIRPVASSTLTSSPTTTTLQLSEIQTKPNAHPTTEPAAGAVAAAVSPPVNGSLIDLTDEDDTTTLAMHVKRAKTCAAPSMPSSTLQPIASNQLIRIQHRINAVEGGGSVGETVVSTVVTSSSGGLISQYNNSPMVRVSQNANRANNAAPVLQPIRHPIYNSNLHRLPASTGKLFYVYIFS
uniref:Uncharacterized protein n=1 Tax=Anopheles maculatus TaxID=74869 RepID=A0A182T2U3_9DIPT